MKTGKTPSPWKTERTDEVADCRVFRVQRRTSRRISDGTGGDWYVVDTRDFVNVVALTPRRELVLVRQFRHGVDALSLELPGGMVDAGEDPLAAGLRELREETGFAGDGGEVFAWCHPNPAIMNNRCHYVFAPGVEPVSETDWDEHEEMEILLMPFGEVAEACRRGDFTHALTLAALQRFSNFYPSPAHPPPPPGRDFPGARRLPDRAQGSKRTEA
ncbi:MAG: NUDIX hydrolase [Puniceicoccaceae bacterium]